MAVLKKEEMLSLAEKAVKAALQRGAEDAEVYVYEGQATSIGIERGQITKNSRIIDHGLGVRVAVKRAIGFAYTNTTEKQTTIDDTIGKAVKAAKASKPDWDWRGLPEKKPCAKTEGTFDQKIVDLGSEDLVNVASTMLDAGSKDKRVFPIEGGCGAAYVANALANSNGVSGFDKGTMIECSLATVAKKKTSVTPVCFEFNASRNYKVDPKWVGKEAARLAVSALETQPIETKNMKLILTQFALQELLYFTLINAVKADNVQRNQSPFKGKIGAKVEIAGLLWPERRRLWFTCREGTWSISPEPSLSLKGPHRYGPLKLAFLNRPAFVFGTAGTPEENAWAFAKARYDAEVLWYSGNASIEVVPDAELELPADRDRNIILYGHAQSNRAWEPLLADSPVQVEPGLVRIGERELRGDSLACLFLRPRPDSGVASVGVVAGTGVVGMRLTRRRQYFGVGGVPSPDCLVFAREGNLVAGYFGVDWGVESGEFAWADQTA